MITISIDARNLARKLSDFPEALARAQKNALEWIGTHVASDATRAFKTESLRPSPWAPRKSGGKHPLLIRSGNLRQSITWRWNGDDAVVVGSPAKYARYHQFGTKRMPARPFFPFDEQGRLTAGMKSKIDKNVARIFKEEMGKLGRG